MSIWKTSSRDVQKPWGNEKRFDSPFGIAGKIINMKAEHRTSLKHYQHRNQVMYCMSGKISVFAPNEKEFGDFFTEEGNYFDLVQILIIFSCLVDKVLLPLQVGRLPDQSPFRAHL